MRAERCADNHFLKTSHAVNVNQNEQREKWEGRVWHIITAPGTYISWNMNYPSYGKYSVSF